MLDWVLNSPIAIMAFLAFWWNECNVMMYHLFEGQWPLIVLCDSQCACGNVTTSRHVSGAVQQQRRVRGGRVPLLPRLEGELWLVESRSRDHSNHLWLAAGLLEPGPRVTSTASASRRPGPGRPGSSRPTTASKRTGRMSRGWSCQRTFQNIWRRPLSWFMFG